MSLNKIFKGIFDSSSVTNIGTGKFLLCIIIALATGLLIAYAYTYKTKYTKSFVVTLATLPAVVAMVIMMVNGNLGAGVAVAGTFSLVRFRSVPGTAKEIGAIFLAMGTGLAFGMGYLGYGVLFAAIICLTGMIYSNTSFGNRKSGERTLKITIPEDLEYSEAFEDLLNTYTSKYELTQVKTTNMGSLFRLTYDIILKDETSEKAFIDDLRTRNGNLEIAIHEQSENPNEL